MVMDLDGLDGWRRRWTEHKIITTSKKAINKTDDKQIEMSFNPDASEKSTMLEIHCRVYSKNGSINSSFLKSTDAPYYFFTR